MEKMVSKTEADRMNDYYAVSAVNRNRNSSAAIERIGSPLCGLPNVLFMKILEKVYKNLMVPDTMNIILQYCMYCCL